MNYEAMSWFVPIWGVVLASIFSGVLVWHLRSAFKKKVVFRFSRIPTGESAFVSKAEDPAGYWYGVATGLTVTAICIAFSVFVFIHELLPKLLSLR
jgi:hypothetical protein